MFGFFSLIAIIICLSLLLIIHEFGHFLAAKKIGLLVEEFGIGFPPRLWSKKIGETKYSINWIPFGAFVRIYGMEHSEERANILIERSFSHQSVGKRALVACGGIVMNFFIGWLLLSAVFMVGIPQTLLVTDVKQGSVAESAGIQNGDQLVDYATVQDLRNFVDENRGQKTILKINRNGEFLDVNIVPRKEVSAESGNLGIFLAEVGSPKLGFFASLWTGLKDSFRMVGLIFLGFIDLIAKALVGVNVMEYFLGPVGIANIAAQTAKLGAVHFLQLLAMISLNLSVFNIFPIPALDGSSLLFLLIEKIKGKPLNPKIETSINATGFLFLIFLMAMVTIKDIWSLF